MKKSNRLKCILVILIVSHLQFNSYAFANNSEKTKFKIASIDWCPQMCLGKNNKGYIQDIVELVFSSDNYELEIHYFPWSRAIKVVNEGHYDALLAPAKEEAPRLTYPKTAIGKQQMCFFVSTNSEWLYKGPKSLSALSIGVAKDAFLEELDYYKSSNQNQFQYLPYLDRYVYQSAMKLLKGRIDTFLFTKNTTLFELQQTNLDAHIREAGCLSKSDIYIAFTPVVKKSSKVKLLIDDFDRGMAKYYANGEIGEIMKKYNID